MTLSSALVMVLLGASTGVDGLPELLARHRAAMGGDRAVELLRHQKITSRIREYGLTGTETFYADGPRRRTDDVFPDLPMHQVDIWDGDHLIEQGTNGDVRSLQGPEIEAARTDAVVSSLDYVQANTQARVTRLPPVDEGGQHYDRIQVTVSGGRPVELWLDSTGMTRRRVATVEGTVTTVRIDAYGTYQGIPLPKRTSTTTSTETNVLVTETLKVELPRSLAASLFATPLPRSDAIFPAGKTSVTLPLSLCEGRWVVVQGRLGGRLGNFLLDTGASLTAYDFAFLAKTGARIKGEIAPAGGLFKGISFVRTGAFELGGMQLGPQTVLALDLHAPDSVFPVQLDGILGYDFLSRFPMTIDFVGGWLTFWKPGAYRPVAEEKRIPFTFAGTALRVPVSINGERAGTFQLDIGNGSLCSVQHAPLAHPLSHDKALLYAHGQEFGTGSAAAYKTHADLTIGEGDQSVTWAGAPIAALDTADPNAASVDGNGNIGNAFFRHFRVTFDYASSMMYLLQREPFRPASLFGDYGLEIHPRNGKLVLRDVPEHGPAALAGLKTGDELVEVDGIPAVLVDNQAPELLHRPVPGETHTVRVRRAKDIITVQLTAAAVP